jgi:hypothetical protein
LDAYLAAMVPIGAATDFGEEPTHALRMPPIGFKKTEGPSDLYLQSNTWQHGGSTGWHRHPGHSLIVITITKYR